MRCLILVFFGLEFCMLQMGLPPPSEMAEPDECEHKGCDCNCNCASPIPVYPLGGSHNTHHASDEISNDYGHRPSYSGYSGGYSRPKCINRDCECECNCLYESIPYIYNVNTCSSNEDCPANLACDLDLSICEDPCFPRNGLPFCISAAVCSVENHIPKCAISGQHMNAAPIARITPATQRFPLGFQLGLSGSQSSDPEGGPLSFDWTVPSGLVGVVQTPDFPEEIAISGTVPGVFIVTLKVTDEDGNEATSTATVTVDPNSPPVANIQLSSPKITLPDDMVTLDGSSSSDLDGGIVSYEWNIISGPDGDSVELPLPEEQLIVLDGLVAGVYRFRLTVIDSFGLTNSTDATLTVLPEED